MVLLCLKTLFKKFNIHVYVEKVYNIAKIRLNTLYKCARKVVQWLVLVVSNQW